MLRGGGIIGPATECDGEGFPSKPAWGWNKAPPKTSLATLSPSRTWNANSLMLNLVEMIHYAPGIPAFIFAYKVVANSDFWLKKFDGDSMRLYLFVITQVLSFCGGLPGFVMHTYEGWQVSPFLNPLCDKELLKVQEKNNQWLREVAYKFIFIMQYVGLATLAMAVYGPDGPDFLPLHGQLYKLFFVGLAVAYLGNQSNKMTFTLWGQSTFPLAWSVFIPFVSGALLNWFAWNKLAGETVGVVKAVGPGILIALGGAYEGLVAETRFYQYDHFLAVLAFFVGIFMQLDTLGKLMMV
ncbi:MAG: hypothetical protein SGBAC_010130 [Bacillariaceae sp.]